MDENYNWETFGHGNESDGYSDVSLRLASGISRPTKGLYELLPAEFDVMIDREKCAVLITPGGRYRKAVTRKHSIGGFAPAMKRLGLDTTGPKSYAPEIREDGSMVFQFDKEAKNV